MKPTLYPNGFPSAYEELKTFYPVFYRDVFEMDAIWRAAGGGLDEIEDGVDAVVNNNFVSLMDTDALAQMETFLGIPLNQKRTLEARRKLVASYFIGGNHIGAREIKDITRAFTEGTCEVSFVGGTVYIHVKSDVKDTPPEDDYYYILRKRYPRTSAYTPTSKSSSRSGSMLARTHSRATGTTLYPRHLSARAQPESCAPAAISRRATGLASTRIRSPASRLRPGSTQRPSSSNRAKRPLTCLHRSGAAHRTRSTPAQAWLRAAERPQT